jgi:hypothetical protein
MRKERERETGFPKYENVSQIIAFIRFTTKYPGKVKQQTLHTAYVEQAINKKTFIRRS